MCMYMHVLHMAQEAKVDLVANLAQQQPGGEGGVLPLNELNCHRGARHHVARQLHEAH